MHSVCIKIVSNYSQDSIIAVFFSLSLSAGFFRIFFFRQFNKILSTVQRHQTVLREGWRQKQSMMGIKQASVEGQHKRKTRKEEGEKIKSLILTLMSKM